MCDPTNKGDTDPKWEEEAAAAGETGLNPPKRKTGQVKVLFEDWKAIRRRSGSGRLKLSPSAKPGRGDSSSSLRGQKRLRYSS